MILLKQFLKQHTVRRIGDLSNVSKLTDLIALPKGSVLHVIDGLDSHATPQLVPDLTNPLFQLAPTKKQVLFNTQFHDNVAGLVEVQDNKFKRPVGTIAKSLMEFRKVTRGLVRYVDSPAELVSSSMIQPVICHNNLRRYRIRGMLAYYKLFNRILAEIINTVATRPDLHHIIGMEWGHVEFDRNQFVRSFAKHTNSTLVMPENANYLFLCHLLAWLNPNATSTFLKGISETYEEKITFALYRGVDVIFYNLAQLKEVVNNPSMSVKVLKQINLLTTTSPKADLSTSILNSPEEPIKDGLKAPEQALGVIPGVLPTTSNTVYEEPNNSIPIFEAAIDQELEELDAAADEAIERGDNITPAQQRRIKGLGVAFKTTTLDPDGPTIEELLKVNPDVPIDIAHLDMLDGQISDPSMLDSRTASFDHAYMEELFDAHMAKVLVAFNVKGMFLTGVTHEDEINEFARVRHYSITYEDANHKRTTIKFTMPIVDPYGMCLVNGVQKTMKKQRVNNPIVKSSPVRVALSSYYNKTIVERIGTMAHSFAPFFVKHARQAGGKIDPGKSPDTEQPVVFPFEYDALRGKMRGVIFNEAADGRGKTFWTFNYDARLAKIQKTDRSTITKLETEHGIYVGKTGKDLCFLQVDGSLNILNLKTKESRSSTLLDELDAISTKKIPPHSEYVDLKILNAKIPLGMILSYRYGLIHMLDFMDANYQIHEKGKRIDVPSSSLRLRFKDKTVVISRSPADVFLIFAGLSVYDLRDILLEEMEEKDAYYELMDQKKLSTNYLKGVDSFFELFIDPITKGVLLKMGEPTEIRGLLIRATQLIMTTDFEPAGSTKNCRIRSYERMVGILYNEMARALATYQNKSIGSRDKFTINPQAVDKRIMTDQLMVNVDTINPIHDIKSVATISHLGDGGRSEQTFMIPDRRFTDDSVGVLSEATVDSGRVGIIRQLSVDPNLTNLMGLSPGGGDNIEPTNLLSITGLLFPGVTSDD